LRARIRIAPSYSGSESSKPAAGLGVPPSSAWMRDLKRMGSAEQAEMRTSLAKSAGVQMDDSSDEAVGREDSRSPLEAHQPEVGHGPIDAHIWVVTML
jgi:hypothetical protein